MHNTKNWISLGRIFDPTDRAPWMRSHAANPTPLHIKDDLFRVYFSTRNQENRARTGWVLIDLKEPERILAVSPKPEFELGKPGTFDDAGCSLGSILKDSGRYRLYYMGWNLSPTTPFRNAIGVAVTKNPLEASFQKSSEGPLMDRDFEDPISLSYPFVFKARGLYTMIYGSHLAWNWRGHPMRHLLKYATSKDGLVWTRKGLLKGLDESGIYAQSRPSMVKIGNRYHVWYCKRGSEYVLGHAEGNTIQNVKANHRLAKVLFDENSKEFEPTVSYPYAFRHKQNLYLLYCGENYGRGGFKLAQLKNIV